MRSSTAPRIGLAFSLALEAATRHRLRLFPLYGINRRGVCECPAGENCDKAGKHPRITGYFDAASRDVRQLENWYRQWPGSNWGYQPLRNGLAALDVDERNGGLKTLAELEGTFGKLTPTPRCNSGSGRGSFHALFKHPGKGWRLKGTLGKGVEVITRKLLVLAGGNHHSGGVYAWDDLLHINTLAFAPFPDWALQLAGEFTGEDETGKQMKTEDNGGQLKQFLSLPAPFHLSSSVYLPPEKATTKTTTGTPQVVDGYHAGTEPQERAGKPRASAEDPKVSALIRQTIPNQPGNRNRQLWPFVRGLKGLPGWATADRKTLKAAARQWHALALPNITTQDFETTWSEFLYAWPRVKCPKGAGTVQAALNAATGAPNPLECQNYDDPKTHLLIRWCAELQRMNGSDPFYLSAATVETKLSMSRRTAWLRLGMLVEDGVLAEVRRGDTKKATRYRYVGGTNA